MGNKRRGFTLFEFLVSMAVMALIGGVSVMRIGTAMQKPKHEAEKIAAYFVRLTEKADRTKADFTAEISGNNIAVKWNGNTEVSEKLALDSKLAHTAHFNEKNISDTNVKAWTYKGGSDVKIMATDSLSGSYSTVNGRIDYDYGKNGHMYLAVTSGASSPHYVVITSADIAQ